MRLLRPIRKYQPICKYDESHTQRLAVSNHKETIKSLRAVGLFFLKPQFSINTKI